jgi:hypothetical protein
MNTLTEAMIMLIYYTYIWVQKTCVGLFNMAGVILNQGWIRVNHVINANQRLIDRAIRYFAMVVWCLALMVITVTTVMILFAIIVFITSTVLYLAFGVEIPGSKVFVIY